MKKNIITIFIAIIVILNLMPITYVQAMDERSTGGSGGTTSSWVSDAFSAAKSFLEEPVQDDLGGAKNILNIFKNIIKAVNRILLVVLFGLSAIALSVVGIRYILAGGDPTKLKAAKTSIRTVFIGMAYGFGAFTIWSIAMGLVRIVIGTLAQ